MKSKTLSEQIRRSNEKRSPISFEAWLMLIRKRTVPVIIKIVVITYIEGRARIRIPSKQKLAAHISA